MCLIFKLFAMTANPFPVHRNMNFCSFLNCARPTDGRSTCVRAGSVVVCFCFFLVLLFAVSAVPVPPTFNAATLCSAVERFHGSPRPAPRQGSQQSIETVNSQLRQ
eukprot:Selendium_serpulae@DN6285_c1_g1_i6.p1